MMEPEVIGQLAGQFGGLGLFAYLVWRTLSESMRKLVESLGKLGETMEKHTVALTQLAERTERISSNVDRMIDSQRTKRGVSSGSV